MGFELKYKNYVNGQWCDSESGTAMVGLTHVNVHSAYKEPQHCFGGYKCSGFGLPEAGRVGIEFFQAEKVVHIAKRYA